MLATSFRGNLPDRFFIQRKLDGVRAIAAADGIWSRSGRRITSCRHIEHELRPVFAACPNLVLDGELYHHDLRDNLFSIISAVNRRASAKRNNQPTIQFHVYDLPSSEQPFSCREAALQQIRPALGSTEGSIKVVETAVASSRCELDRYLEHALADGYEGAIIRKDAPYSRGRSGNLLKFKPFEDDEFDLVALEEVQGTQSGFAQRARFRLPDGRIFKAGLKCSRASAADLLNGDYRSATVRYFGLTPSGIPRSPVAVAFHHSPDARL